MSMLMAIARQNLEVLLRQPWGKVVLSGVTPDGAAKRSAFMDRLRLASAMIDPLLNKELFFQQEEYFRDRRADSTQYEVPFYYGASQYGEETLHLLLVVKMGWPSPEETAMQCWLFALVGGDAIFLREDSYMTPQSLVSAHRLDLKRDRVALRHEAGSTTAKSLLLQLAVDFLIRRLSEASR